MDFLGFGFLTFRFGAPVGGFYWIWAFLDFLGFQTKKTKSKKIQDSKTNPRNLAQPRGTQLPNCEIGSMAAALLKFGSGDPLGSSQVRV